MTGDKNITPPDPEKEEDDDRTRLMPFAAPLNDEGAPKPGDDDDRTLLASDGIVSPQDVPTQEPGDDRTVLEPNRAGSESAQDPSTYRPFSEGTAAPIGAAAASALGQRNEGTQTGSPDGGAGHSPIRSLEPGMIINNMYRVEERIDHGGMGRVFRGVEMGTGEPVAIKVILPEMAEDPRVAQMFRREARTLRQLHHDAIVRYFAYVPPDASFNLHALVMGFINGTKLSDKIKQDGPLSQPQACQLFLRLADGLDQAHKIGVVHRDLSPDNVMLPDSDISRAMLIDFGISRSSKLPEGTLGNEFAGKLKYVSPEQLGAYGGEADGPSDVYSLALLMIYTLTGKALAMGDSIVEAVQKRQSVPDLSPVPGPFQTLLYHMLQPDPAQRTKTMEQVIAGLQSIAGGDTPSSAPTTIAPTGMTVPGLQSAPHAAIVGQSTMTQAPRPETAAPLPEEDRRGSGGLLAVVALLAMVAGGVWYAMGMPWLPVEPSEQARDDDGLTRLAGSREAFLAENTTAACSYASRRTKGLHAGMIEGFAAQTADLKGIDAAYGDAFGAKPTLVTQQVTSAQCAALAAAHRFQGTSGGAIELTLDGQKVSRSKGVVGVIHGSAGRKNWLALVAPSGRVFSLMRQLAQPIGEQRGFSFRLPSAEPGTYLLIATASDKALIRAGAMTEGTQADVLLPLISSELAKDGQGAIDIGIVELTP